MLGNLLWNFACPRIEAVDHDRLHRDERGYQVADSGCVVPRLLPELEIIEVRHIFAPVTCFSVCGEGSRTLLCIDNLHAPRLLQFDRTHNAADARLCDRANVKVATAASARNGKIVAFTTDQPKRASICPAPSDRAWWHRIVLIGLLRPQSSH
jgi:hypothetical protein